MRYLEFRNQFHKFQAFSLHDIQKYDAAFDSRRLVEWQAKGYVRRIINRWYRLTEVPLSEQSLFRIANRIYAPSYVSLQSALGYYSMIPEAVFEVRSISTRKTQTFLTEYGQFAFRNIKPSAFFGYQILRIGEEPLLIAEPEKALLDLCYLSPQLDSTAAFEALRLTFPERFAVDKFWFYAKAMQNKALITRLKYLKPLLPHAHIKSN